MCYPINAKAWKHFGRTHPKFDTKSRNVRFSCCADGFALHGFYEKIYSC